MGILFSRFSNRKSTKYLTNDLTNDPRKLDEISDDIIEHAILEVDDEVRHKYVTTQPKVFRYPPVGRKGHRDDGNAPDGRISVAPPSAANLGEFPIKPGETSGKLI